MQHRPSTSRLPLCVAAACAIAAAACNDDPDENLTSEDQAEPTESGEAEAEPREAFDAGRSGHDAGAGELGEAPTESGNQEIDVANLHVLNDSLRVVGAQLVDKPSTSKSATIIPRCGSDKRTEDEVACTEPGPIDVAIVGVEQNELSVELAREYPDREPRWDVEFEAITDPDYLGYRPTTAEGENLRDEYRGSAAVIYPAREGVRALDPAALPSSGLPDGVEADTAQFALDLDSDDRPDWVHNSYCCKQPSKPPQACDYTCSRTYRRTGDGWQLIGSSQPL